MNGFWQRHRLLPFIIWLLLFYLGWLALVLVGGYQDTVMAHWPMAVVMAIGSCLTG